MLKKNTIQCGIHRTNSIKDYGVFCWILTEDINHVVLSFILPTNISEYLTNL